MKNKYPWGEFIQTPQQIRPTEGEYAGDELHEITTLRGGVRCAAL